MLESVEHAFARFQSVVAQHYLRLGVGKRCHHLLHPVETLWHTVVFGKQYYVVLGRLNAYGEGEFLAFIVVHVFFQTHYFQLVGIVAFEHLQHVLRVVERVVVHHHHLELGIVLLEQVGEVVGQKFFTIF